LDGAFAGELQLFCFFFAFLEPLSNDRGSDVLEDRSRVEKSEER
jgi:hypothetical protein